jgi:putative flippase GtrA
LAHHQAIRFTVVSVGSLVINLVVLEVLVSSASMNELAAQAIAVAVAMPFNFLGNKLWTFT